MPASKRTGSKPAYGSKKMKNALGRQIRQVVQDIEEKKFIVFNTLASTGQATFNEWKFNSLLVEHNADPSLGAGITQGAAVNQRIGNKIKLQGIDLIVKIEPRSTIDLMSGFCRFCVVHDKRSNGSTALTATQVFTTDDHFGFPNPNYTDRFTITNDWVHSVVATSGTTAGPDGLYKIHIPAKSVIEYSGAGTLPTILNHGWWFGFVTDKDDCCTLQVKTIVYYTDA